MTDKDQLILENLRLLWDRKIAPESALDFIHNVLSYPTQDGTAEENIESYWIESDDLGGGMHLMVFKSDYIRAMHRYAAPLRSEIERLKSELAASVSPKLVLPELKPMPRLNDTEYTERRVWNECIEQIKRLNPSLFK